VLEAVERKFNRVKRVLIFVGFALAFAGGLVEFVLRSAILLVVSLPLLGIPLFILAEYGELDKLWLPNLALRWMDALDRLEKGSSK
jgi:hypothetical protein